MKLQTLRQKALSQYYLHLQELQGNAVSNEEGLRPAFQGLLINLGREQGWTLVPEVRLPTAADRMAPLWMPIRCTGASGRPRIARTIWRPKSRRRSPEGICPRSVGEA